MATIFENVSQLIRELPHHVQLVAAAKTRTPDEIREAVDAGIRIIGENYVQEAAAVFNVLGRSVRYHCIGHLQRNKVAKAVEIFDTIETVDTFKIAEAIDRQCASAGKSMPVLIEINSAREPQKAGVFPELAEGLIREISNLKNIRIHGLMTMGPFLDQPEAVRPFFRETKKCFDRIGSLRIPNVEMRILSMGMSDSYRIAVEEGANLVRIGTKIFGERNPITH